MKKSIRHRIVMLCSCVLIGILSGPFAVAAESLKITVYGGSGRIGQRIVNEALNRGHAVTIAVRDPASVKEKRARLSVVKGDVLDTDAVARQMAGQDAVVTSVNGREPGFYPKVAESLVGAARKVSGKAPRILWVGGATSLSPEPGVKPRPETDSSLPPFMQGHWLALKYLRGVNDVSWTVLTPPEHIDEGTRTGKFRLGTEVLLKDANGKSTISMEDYAVAMLDEIEKPQHIRARFTVAY